MKKEKWLFGFRSGTFWKKILATAFYLSGALVLLIGLFSPPLIEAGGKDALLYYLTVVILFLWIESPAIFLSDTPFRERLPLFKQHNLLGSLAGMMCVCVLFTYLFAMVDNFHTAEYKDRFHAFMGFEYVIEELPENEG